MAANIRRFLHLLSDAELTTMRDKVVEALLLNERNPSVSINGKNLTHEYNISVTALAEQLTPVLEARGIIPANHTNTQRQTRASFL